jgi:hypothetical protein
MKIFSNRTLLLLGSTLFVALPATVLLPGCGGGGSSDSLPAIRLFSAPVQLSQNQTARLNVRLRGITIEGDLVVNEPTGANPGPRPGALPFNVPAGTYALTGTFTAPRGFTLTGDFPAPLGTFTITGQIPTSSDTGSFAITVGNNTVSGTFPRI